MSLLLNLKIVTRQRREKVEMTEGKKCTFINMLVPRNKTGGGEKKKEKSGSPWG